MNPYLAHHLMMVRPARFGHNKQTQSTNHFQQTGIEESIPGEYGSATNIQAWREFDESVQRMRAAGIQITVWDDEPEPAKPDAVFLNNWFSTHHNGQFILYPMMAANRRTEMQPRYLAHLKALGLAQGMDLSHFAERGAFLEGTGSLVFDHRNRQAIATASPRTHRALAADVATHLGYSLQFITACDPQGNVPYHTNVVLSAGDGIAVACLDAIPDLHERNNLRHLLAGGQRTLIEISPPQMNAYCANVLEVQNHRGQPFLVASRTAWQAFTAAQQQKIEGAARPLILDIPLIERVGGGSARCMLAELFGVAGNEATPNHTL